MAEFLVKAVNNWMIDADKRDWTTERIADAAKQSRKGDVIQVAPDGKFSDYAHANGSFFVIRAPGISFEDAQHLHNSHTVDIEEPREIKVPKSEYDADKTKALSLERFKEEPVVLREELVETEYVLSAKEYDDRLKDGKWKQGVVPENITLAKIASGETVSNGVHLKSSVPHVVLSGTAIRSDMQHKRRFHLRIEELPFEDQDALTKSFVLNTTWDHLKDYITDKGKA